MNNYQFLVKSLAALVTLFCLNAIAQEEQSAAVGGEAKAEASGFIEEVVVTGSGGGNLTALETSYGVAILDADDIRKGSPSGLADLVDAVPGLQGELSQGETNTNLNVRGTQGGFNSFISLQEDGLPVQYSPFFSEFELRHDLSFERVEAVLGGPSGIFTAQGAAATINYISRRPTEKEGEANLSVTDYGKFRTDFFYGGPINNNGWYGAAGGFFRHGDAIRDTGYTAFSGGQIRASLTKEFDNSSLAFAYKRIDDTSPYFNPLPTSTRNPGSPGALPGFDARSNALSGPDVRVIRSKRPDGKIVARDLADGNVSKTDQFTLSFDHDFGNGFSISDKARFSRIRTIAHDFRGGSDSGLRNAEDFVADQLAKLQAAFPTVRSTRLVRVNDGRVIANPSTLNGNGLLAIHDLIEYDRQTDNFINDFRLNWENSMALLTLGLQSWLVDTKSGNSQDQYLIDIRSNANRYDVQGLDAAGNVAGRLTNQGVITYGSLDNYGGLETNSQNIYVNAEFSVTDDLRIDIGARHEWGKLSAFGEDLSPNVPIAGGQNNNILADNARRWTRNGKIFTGKKDYQTNSLTIGGNYAITDDLAVYARWASAEDMNFVNEFSFYNIPAFGTPPGANLKLSDKPADLTFAEIGVRYLGERISGYLTYFDTEHKNAGSIVASRTGAATVLSADTLANGIEFWLDLELLDSLWLNLSGVVMDAERKSSGGSLPVNRVPETQLRFTPTYYIGNFEVFSSVQYYGKRNHDDNTAASAVTLPAYYQVDLGASFNFNEQLTISLLGKNLTNEFGFTSANFRGIMPSAAARYNSTIPGCSFMLSANYRF